MIHGIRIALDDGPGSSKNGSVDWRLIVPLVARTLDKEGALGNYCVYERKIDVSSPDVWKNICKATAWAVLDGYANEKGLR